MVYSLPLGTLIFQFQDITDGFNHAISSSVSKYTLDKIINHVGIVIAKDVVAEAVPQIGVRSVSLNIFLNKGIFNKAVLVKDELPIKDVIAKVYSWLGQPYNSSFYPQSEGYYCSELITEAFNIVAQSVYFDLHPMNFKNKDTNDYIPFWIEYFRLLNCSIPQGVLGSHPFSLSQQRHRFKEMKTL